MDFHKVVLKNYDDPMDFSLKISNTDNTLLPLVVLDSIVLKQPKSVPKL